MDFELSERRLPRLVVTAAVVAALWACDGDPPGPAGPAPPAGREAARPAPPPARMLTGPPDKGDPRAFDEALLGDVIHWAAFSGDLAPLRGLVLPPRVSKPRVAVTALHDALLARRGPPATLAGLFAALDAFAAAEGGAEPGVDVRAMVARWRAWSEDDRAAEAASAALVREALALLAAPGSPDTAALARIAARLEGTAPPKGSPAAGSASLVGLVAQALAAPRGDFDQDLGPLRAAQALCDAAGWPGATAGILAPLAAHLIRIDETSIRTVRLFDVALAACTQNGDPLAGGLLVLDRAMHTPDLRRAEAIARRGRKLVEESGADGPESFHALEVHATRLQALGRHRDAVDVATVALAQGARSSLDPAGVARMRGLSAVSLFRLGYFRLAGEDALRAVAALPPDAPGAERAGLLETAAEAALEAGRPADAAALYREAAAANTGKRAADADLLHAAGADVAAGRTSDALATIRALLDERAHPPEHLALAATALIEAGELDVAAQIVEQAEAALGRDRRDAFGEVAGRLLVARGDVDAARERFSAVLAHITGRRPGAYGPPAASILFRWAELEESTGDLERARGLYRLAHQHVADGQAPVPRDRARREMIRLARAMSEFGEAHAWAAARHRDGEVGDVQSWNDVRLDLFLLSAELAFRHEPAPKDPSGVPLPGYREQAERIAAEFGNGNVRSVLLAYLRRLEGWEVEGLPERVARIHAVLRAQNSPSVASLRQVYETCAEQRDGDIEVRRRVADVGLQEALSRRLPDDALRLTDEWSGQSFDPLPLARLDADDGFLLVLATGEVQVTVRGNRAARSLRTAVGLRDALRAFRDACAGTSAEAVLAAARSVGEALALDPEKDLGGAALVLIVPEPDVLLPWDLVEVGGRPLGERVPLAIVASSAEFGERVGRDAGDGPVLDRTFRPAGRSALVTARGARAASPDLLAAFADERAKGATPATALWLAKTRLREQRDESGDAVPPWASVLLRGVPR